MLCWVHTSTRSRAARSVSLHPVRTSRAFADCRDAESAPHLVSGQAGRRRAGTVVERGRAGGVRADV